jgi:hypothetical protein
LTAFFVFAQLQKSLNKKTFSLLNPASKVVITYGLNDKKELDEKVVGINYVSLIIRLFFLEFCFNRSAENRLAYCYSRIWARFSPTGKKKIINRRLYIL